MKPQPKTWLTRGPSWSPRPNVECHYTVEHREWPDGRYAYEATLVTVVHRDINTETW